jgi:hypothetical protein
MENYKIFEERLELTKEQISEGMNFNSVLKTASTPGIFKSGVSVTSKMLVILGVTSIIASTILLIMLFASRTKPNLIQKQNHTIDTTTFAISPLVSDSLVPKKEAKHELLSNSDKKAGLTRDSNLNEIKTNSSEIVIERISLPFEKLINADSRYAILIKDSIYGPTNVSLGYGTYKEYKEKTDLRLSEQNSAWFKFTIKKDTLLTFHIVPQLGTDDYDFVLYKVLDDKLEMVRSCFSYNTTLNKNTGLSNSNMDTTYHAKTWGGTPQGKTYAQALKVKANETYYLMINNSMGTGQDPSGFTIYFYNYLPKNKANRYQ